MRKLAFLLLLSFVLVPSAPAQTRQDTYNAASLEVEEAVLTRLPDGGCAARWCGSVTSTDGGNRLNACSAPRELSVGANRTACLNALDLGAPRVRQALKFQADAGSQ